MNIEKLKISDEKFDLNLKFYFWLKHLVKTQLTDLQSNLLLEIILRDEENFDLIKGRLEEYLINIKAKKKSEAFSLLISTIDGNKDLSVFRFALRLYMIKDILLQEAKIKTMTNIEEMSKLDPLSLEYDEKSLYNPYSTRVNGALLALLFFDRIEEGNTNFISSASDNYIKALSKEAIELKKLGLESNQIFMLMFSESINQSIISDSGSNYEDRIWNVLVKIGIDKEKIRKIHDKEDSSTEFDFFFEHKNKKYGIGAKKTLRERYKQFIKTSVTSNDVDVMIEITLGLDLNLEKAKTILKHGTILFVSDEIYQSRNFLKTLDGVYSVKELTLKTLESL